MTDTPPRIPILIVITSLDSGGAERHLLHTLPRLDPRLFAIEIFPLRPHGALRSQFQEQGIHVHEPRGNRFQMLRALSALIRERHPIVHCFLPEAYLFGAPLALAFGAHACLMSRRSRNHYQTRRRVAGWCERRLHRFMDCLLANSAVVAKDLREEGAPRARIRLIYNGIDIERFAAGTEKSIQRTIMRRTLEIDEETIVLCCVANLFHYKGHADLLEALALLGDTFTENSVLLLVGRDVGEEARLREQSTRLGLSSHIRFLGERDDVPAILAASDIGILASHEEGFSNAVLEGMAAGLPMVVTDVGGNAEAVSDGICGHVVPRQNPPALSEALADLFANPERRHTYGRIARQRVDEQFSLAASVRAYGALYQEHWPQKKTQRK